MLTRRPDRRGEREESPTLPGKAGNGRDAGAVGRLAWALLASTEFGVNH